MITLYGCAAMLALAGAPSPEAPAKASKPAVAQKASGKPTPAKPGAGKPAPGAQPETAASAQNATLERVQRFYAEVQDYSADFIQSYTKAALSKTSESRGVLEIKKPGLMRWTYQKPAEKLWIVDGKKLWVSDPEEEQVFVDENFKTAELTNAISFLWGKGRLDESFEVRQVGNGQHEVHKELQVLELTPKKGATYTKLVLGVDPKTGEVAESILFETAGNTNRFKFRNAKVNTGIPDARFQFTPPPGWSVIHR